MTTILPTGYVNQERLLADLEWAKQRLSPEVIRVKHSVGLDHSDEPSITPRVVVTDSVFQAEDLGSRTGPIREVSWEEVRPYETWGMRMYIRLRTQSEVARLNDPAWA